MFSRSCFSFSLSVVILLLGLAWPKLLFGKVRVEFDRGHKSRVRHFESVDRCARAPCVITQWGAIRFPKGVAKKRQVRIGALHRGQFHSIALFEESTTFEQKLSERVFNRKPNRAIVSLEQLLETGATDTIYLYGVLLQHDLDEGDLIAVHLPSGKAGFPDEEYYFRYHHEGFKFDIDIAFVQPINLFTPNPGDVIQAAYSTVALSFSMARAMDPDQRYNLLQKMIRAVRFNLISGLLLRRDVASFNGDSITKDYFDGFGGLGLTFFDFLALGYGANIARSPHTTFPFVGIEVRHLFEFLRSLKADTHTRWQKYLKEELSDK